MRMRLRLPELMAEHKLTAYGVAKASKGRIALTTIYRLIREEREEGKKVASFNGELLEALCDVFGVGPAALLEREGHGKAAQKKRRKG